MILDSLKRANPNGLEDNLRALGGANILAGGPIHRRKFSFVAGGVSASHVATLHAMALDTTAANAGPMIKALAITRAYARAGAAGTGELAAQTFGATPATGQIAVAPNGDIVALAADALTDVDVDFIPIVLERYELTLPCVAATGVVTIPAPLAARGVVYLHRAEALVGTVTGVKRVLVPGAVNPATPQARLSVDKASIHFTVADAITSVKVVLAVQPKEDVYSLLIGAEPTG